MKQSLLKSSILRGLLSLFFLVAMVENAWGENIKYSFTIATSDFNTTSYAANNGSHTSTAVCTTDASKTKSVEWTSNQVMQSSSAMQWQKSNAYIYNTTDLGTIVSVTETSSGGSFTKYYGTTEHPTSGSTVGNGYFTIKVGNATGKTSQIVVTFEINDGGSSTPTLTSALTSSYTFNSTESGQTDTKTFNLSGANLTANASLAISGTDASMFSVSPTSVSPTDGVFSNKEITLTYSPTAVGNHSAKLTISSTGATSIEINLSGTATAPAVHRSVTWYVNGSEYTTGNPTTDVVDGNKVTVLPTAPTSTDATSTTFVGWSTSEVTAKTNTAPSLLFKDAASAPAVSGGNAKYYAVFAKQSGSAGYSKVTDASNLSAGDVILFVCESTRKAAKGKNSSYSYLDQADVTISNSAIASRGNAVEYTLGGTSSGWTFTSSEGSLGATSASNNALSFTSGTTTWTISISSGNATVKNTGYTTYLKYNSSGSRFSSYASGQSAIQIYKGSVSYQDYTTKMTTPLSAPTLNDVSGIHATSATITWSEVINADGYQYKIGDGDWQTAGNFTQELTGLTAGTEYTVSVRANGSGDYCDGPAASKTFTTLYTVTAASSNNEWGTAQVSLNNTDWANSVETTKGTTVYVKATPAGDTYNHTGWKTTSGSIADGQLTGWTTSATVTAQFALAQRAVLNTPTGMNAAAGVVSTTVSWTAVEHASSYKLIFNGTTYEGLTTTSKEISGLTAGTTYKWTVQAIGDGVSYDNSAVCAEQSFTTTAKALESIAITTAPTKTHYLKGDAFAKDGMVVKATYNNGDVETVAAENYTVSPATFTTTGEQNVTVSFTYNEVEKTTTQAVNVKEKWAVKFVVNGSENTLYEETPDAGITPPTTSKIGDYTFQFWSETNQTEETFVKPAEVTLNAGKYVPTAEKTFYAIYKINKDNSIPGYKMYYSEDGTDNYIGAFGSKKCTPTTDAESAITLYFVDGQLYYLTGTSTKTPNYLSYAGSSSDLASSTTKPSSASWNEVISGDKVKYQVTGENNTTRFLALSGSIIRPYVEGTSGKNEWTKVESNAHVTQSPAYTTAPSTDATPTIAFGEATKSIPAVDNKQLNTYKNTLNTNGDEGVVTYSSSDKTIATVASDGTVTVVKAGTVEITANVAAVAGSWKAGSAKYTLTITKVDPNLKFAQQSKQVYAENSYEINATADSDGEITYNFSNSCASWNAETGKVDVAAYGSTKSCYMYAHIATTDIYNGVTNNNVKIQLNVNDNRKSQEVAFAQPSYEFTNGATVGTEFTNTWADGKAPKTGVTYTSDNTSVAEVDAETGAVTVHSSVAGTATITATIAEGNVTEEGTSWAYQSTTASYTIKVKKADPQIAFSSNEVNNNVGEILDLSTLISTASTASIVYSLPENTIGAELADEVFEATIPGSYVVTASVAENEQYEAGSATITVHASDSRTIPTFAFTQATYTYDVLTDLNLSEKLNNNSDGKVTWSLSAVVDYADVDDKTGYFYATEGGHTVTVNATLEASSTYQAAKASCKVVIKDDRLLANLAFANATETAQIRKSYNYSATSSDYPTEKISYSCTSNDGSTVLFDKDDQSFVAYKTGDYTITATLAGTAEHKETTATCVVTVEDNRKSPMLTLTDGTVNAQKAQNRDVTLYINAASTTLHAHSAATPASDGAITFCNAQTSGNFSIDPQTGAFTGWSAGTYYVKVSIEETDDYLAETYQYNVTVSSTKTSNIALTAAIDEGDYNITKEGCDIDFNVSKANGYTGTISYNVSPAVGASYDEGTSTLHISKAGSYTLTATAPATEGYVSSTASFTINAYHGGYSDPAALSLVARTTSDYYATFSKSESVTFFKADVATINAINVEGNNITITKLPKSLGIDDAEGYFVPANTGVLIMTPNTNEGVGKSIQYYSVAGKTVADLENNLLKPGTGEMTTGTDCKFYRLAYNDFTNKTGLGFYYGAADGAAFKCKTGTAYLAVPNTSGASEVRGFSFDDINGNETVLKAVETVNEENTIYNISGQRVNKVQKSGLYIVNGKTQLIKK